MLKKLEKQDFDRYVEFAYKLALDMTQSGYPTYVDGIKTKKDFIARAREAFFRDGEEILLFERGGRVAGWIHYYHLSDDHYLGTTSFCVAEGMREALVEFIAFARENFSGSELYLGFPKENIEAVEALNAYGFECIEESYNNVLNFEYYMHKPESSDIISITQENFQLFADIHSQYDDDMYWTSQRILNAIDSWRIFIFLQEGKVTGAIYSRIFEDKTMSEIFGIDFPDGIYDSVVYRELLTAVLNDDKRIGTKHMVFFCDEESQSDALACGFHCVGEYVCFQKKL